MTQRTESAGARMADLAPQDRPREKLQRSGVSALGDNELLALLLGHGTAGRGALSIANGLLAAAGGVHGLTRMTGDQIAAVPGLGTALASRVQASVELGRRTLLAPAPRRPSIHTPQDAAALLLPQYGAYPVERVGIVLLDARHRLIRIQLVSVGSLSSSVVSPADVFRPALMAGAAAVIVFHNHPSGDPTPSKDDIELTRRLVATGRVVGVDVLDHVVLADARYCSVRRAGGV